MSVCSGTVLSGSVTGVWSRSEMAAEFEDGGGQEEVMQRAQCQA